MMTKEELITKSTKAAIASGAGVSCELGADGALYVYSQYGFPDFKVYKTASGVFCRRSCEAVNANVARFMSELIELYRQYTTPSKMDQALEVLRRGFPGAKAIDRNVRLQADTWLKLMYEGTRYFLHVDGLALSEGDLECVVEALKILNAPGDE